ncbi:hypothetical protein Y032_0220g2519 [Ancylostoma ceylanicum]|uniref:Uncharacterized protein n=1 Tax=Ancylostoma ceylanicum TaxID=53326 RepID=A0A016SI93_9BILA|nr:hypothetical protein Y032_0220g2519 [Ancylostoma ceylanicum]
MVQRSDKRTPQGETSSSVGRSRRGREKHPQHPPRVRQPLDQDDRRLDGTTSSSRRLMEKVIYDFYSELLDSHVNLPPCHLREDGYAIRSVLPSAVRHTIKSVKSCTAPGLDSIRPGLTL